MTRHDAIATAHTSWPAAAATSRKTTISASGGPTSTADDASWKKKHRGGGGRVARAHEGCGGIFAVVRHTPSE